MLDMNTSNELSREAVRERFAWARRNGFATWLWPDINPKDQRGAAEAVVQATCLILSGEKDVALECNDARMVGLEGYLSGMGPLLGYWIETGRLTAAQDVAHEMRLQLAHNRKRMTHLAAVSQSVANQLFMAGIEPLFFKGMHTAFIYFPEPGVRPLSDIDIYIPPEKMPEAEYILSTLGYEREMCFRDPYMCDWTLPSVRREPRTLTYVHCDDPWNLDVQASLNRRLPTGEMVLLDRLLPMTDRRPWPLSASAQILSQPFLTLHLAAHVSQVLQSASLLRLVELVLIIRADSLSGLLDWNAFLAGAVTLGGRFIYPALFFCEKLAPGTIPQHVLAACRDNTPAKVRAVIEALPLAAIQPLGRHSLRERFMWARGWRGVRDQLICELILDGQGLSPGRTLYNYGTKLLALSRRRLTA
jgi:Uncharacterised nucleotidyltransferase